MVDTAALLGTWKMTSWKREIVATGETIDALGPDPIGYLNYGPDGRFYALVVSRDRLTPATLPPSDAENPFCRKISRQKALCSTCDTGACHPYLGPVWRPAALSSFFGWL